MSIFKTSSRKKPEKIKYFAVFLTAAAKSGQKYLLKKKRKVIGPVLPKKWICPISINVNTET